MVPCSFQAGVWGRGSASRGDLLVLAFWLKVAFSYGILVETPLPLILWPEVGMHPTGMHSFASVSLLMVSEKEICQEKIVKLLTSTIVLACTARRCTFCATNQNIPVVSPNSCRSTPELCLRRKILKTDRNVFTQRHVYTYKYRD